MIEFGNLPPHISIRNWIKMGEAVGAIEQCVGGVKTKRTIGFELLLCKHLVERSLVREVAAALFIVKDVIVFVTGSEALM